MPRFLHTADWQLGLKLRRLTGERGAMARDERFRCVERIAAVAREHQVDAVLVAGDVFDDNQVAPHVIQRTRDVLAGFDPIPVLLLPGNHDPAQPGSALGRLQDAAHPLPHVHVLDTHEPHRADGWAVHPCPLLTRHDTGDPARHLTAREPDDRGVRIALAHGGAHGFGDASDPVNRIDVDAVLAKGFDYVALGDWHGLKQIDPRAWYPGAPEPTAFDEKDPGHVLIVDIQPDAVPDVQTQPVAGLHWHLPEVLHLHGADDVDRLDAWLSGLSPRGSTLVRLSVQGALTLEERARLDDVFARHADELLSLQVKALDVVTAVDDAAVDRLDAPGFLGDALRELAQGDTPAHAEAARLLYRLVQGATS